MRPLRIAAPLVSIVLVASLASVARAYCVGWDPDYHLPKDYYSVRKEFGRSRLVVEGRVRAAQWLDDKGRPAPLKPPFEEGSNIPLRFDPYSGAYYYVDVLRQFKGAPVSQLRIFSENTEARTPLSVGGRYLLFVTRQRADLRDLEDADLGWQYVLDYCGNSGLLAGRRAELQTVARLARSAHPSLATLAR